MTYVSWLIKLIIFLALLGFAINNSDPTKIRYFFGYAWTAPLVLILAAFFVGGVMVGLLFAFRTIFRQRRQIQSLKKELKLQANTVPTPAPAVPAPAATPPASVIDGPVV